MPKDIVFCADGSWSHPDKVQDGTYSHPEKKPGTISGNTNVYKLYDALIPSVDQVPFYDNGVGTKGNFLEKLRGGGLGEGLFEKIKDGYDDIARTYKEGDALHLFGFSRGAFTVNSLAEMLCICGLPEPGKYSRAALEDAFAAYRERDPIRRQNLLAGLKADYGNDPIGHPVKIAQMGVWDMVGSMGIPSKLTHAINERHYGFLSSGTLPANVKAAWQALAIDERREPFKPILWKPPFSPGQEVDQVWFAGVHSDVGGGGRDASLSDIALGWMMRKAASRGLQFDKERFEKLTHLPPANALGPMRDSWNVLWGLIPKAREIPSDAVIASSVVQRLKRDPRYRPDNLKTAARDRLSAHPLPTTMRMEEVLNPVPARGLS